MTYNDIQVQRKKLEDLIYDSILSPTWSDQDKREFAHSASHNLMHRQDMRHHYRRKGNRRRFER